MIPVWQLICPTYGNFGGPGWSGGRYMEDYSEVDWSVQASDSLDDLFRRHDLAYQAAIRDYDRKIDSIDERNRKWEEADLQLIAKLKELPKDPQKWEYRPKTPWYAAFYRRAAILVFGVKVKLV